MRYLFIEAHVDDIALSAGGTIAKLKEQGYNVTVITLSFMFDVGDLTEEWVSARKVLGIDRLDRGFLPHFPVRNFNNHRQEILDYLLEFKYIDFVVTHDSQDFNQDHSVVGKESIRAFKKKNLITYTGNWNTRSINNNYFVSLEKHHVEKKIEALSCYKSQKDRPYMHPDFIWADVLNNGVMCGVKYAEAFKLINYVG